MQPYREGQRQGRREVMLPQRQERQEVVPF